VSSSDHELELRPISSRATSTDTLDEDEGSVQMEDMGIINGGIDTMECIQQYRLDKSQVT